MREGKFIGIPKQILYIKDGTSLMSKYQDDYLIATFYGIRIGVRFDYCVFTLESLLVSMGLKNNKRNLSIVRNSLKILNIENIIRVKENISKITKAKPFKIKIYKADIFFKLYLKAYDMIVINNKGRQDGKIGLLNTYSYIQSRIYNNKEGESANKNGKYHVAFPKHSDFVDNILLSKPIVLEKIDRLVEMNLIRYINSGNYKTVDGNIYKGANCYTNYCEDWKEDVNGSIKQFKEQMATRGYTHTGDKTNKGKKLNKKDE